MIRNLRFEYSAPQITDSVIGEIAPAVDVMAGIDTTFSMALKADLGAGNNGFNRLQVFTPARVTDIQSITIDDGDGEVQTLVRGEDETAEEGEFSALFVNDDQFVFGFHDCAQ